jgi:hypothetical protein
MPRSFSSGPVVPLVLVVALALAPGCPRPAGPDDAGVTCGQPCGTGTLCVDDTCQPPLLSCGNGAAACGTDGGAAGYCAVLASDNANCGACGVVCSSSQACHASACQAVCSAPATRCVLDGGPGTCANLDEDVANCGRCGHPCGVLEVCMAGECASSCAGGASSCVPGDGGVPYCADLQGDPANCGGCGTTCQGAPSATPACSATVCGFTCIPPFVDQDLVAGNGCEVSGYDVSLDDGVIPTPSKTPNVVPAVRAGKQSGGGAAINAYAAEVGSCAASNALLTSSAAHVLRRWQHNISLAAYKQNTPVETVLMPANEAFTYMFTTPATGSGFFQFDMGTSGMQVPSYMSVTATPCDFPPSRALAATTAEDDCYSSMGGGNLLDYDITTSQMRTGACHLLPNTKYYLNLRFLQAFGPTPNLSADSCPAGVTCGGILQMH